MQALGLLLALISVLLLPSQALGQSNPPAPTIAYGDTVRGDVWDCSGSAGLINCGLKSTSNPPPRDTWYLAGNAQDCVDLQLNLVEPTGDERPSLNIDTWDLTLTPWFDGRGRPASIHVRWQLPTTSTYRILVSANGGGDFAYNLTVRRLLREMCAR
jgi:hypothetical protein